MDQKMALLREGSTMCKLCKQPVILTPNSLREQATVITKEGVETPVTITCLCCSRCGKEYPVLVDDSETSRLSKQVQELYIKQLKYTQNQIPKRLKTKYNRLNCLLDFKRRLLAKKFDGALYQFEGDIIQLDYCYHAQ